jgi:hypothetical protein
LKHAMAPPQSVNRGLIGPALLQDRPGVLK